MAAEIKIIPTVTDLRVSGVNIDIESYYIDPASLPDTIVADISEVVGVQNGTSYIEGELIIQMKNHPQNIDYIIDNDGNLILMNRTGDTSNYTVDQNGHLCYIN